MLLLNSIESFEVWALYVLLLDVLVKCILLGPLILRLIGRLIIDKFLSLCDIDQFFGQSLLVLNHRKPLAELKSFQRMSVLQMVIVVDHPRVDHKCSLN